LLGALPRGPRKRANRSTSVEQIAQLATARNSSVLERVRAAAENRPEKPRLPVLERRNKERSADAPREVARDVLSRLAMHQLRQDETRPTAQRPDTPLRQRTALLLVGSLVALAMLDSACALPAPSENASSTEEGINSTHACFATAADTSISGVGYLTSPATYGHKTCPGGYLVDLLSYDPSNTLGTQVSYAGPAPTTQAVCEDTRVVAYVWHKGGASDAGYMGDAEAAGAWRPDVKGVNRCVLPTMNLERQISGYSTAPVQGAAPSYRIALQALTHSNGAIQPVAMATIAIPTPNDQLSQLAGATTGLDALPAGTISADVQSLFNRKGTPAGNAICRATQIDRVLARFTTNSLVRAGGTSATASQRASSIDTIYTALCTSAGTVANLQTGLDQYGHAMMSLWNQLGAAGPALGQFNAANMIGQINNEALGVLVSRCGVDGRDILSFIIDGTLPAGKTGDNLLLGSCSGSTPEAAAQNLGVGVNFPGQTQAQARDQFNKCMLDTAGQDRCSDPRAASAPDPAPDGTVTCLDADFNPMRCDDRKLTCLDTNMNVVPCDSQQTAAHDQIKSNDQKVQDTINTAPDQMAPQDATQNKAVGDATGVTLGVAVADILEIGAARVFLEAPSWGTGILLLGAVLYDLQVRCQADPDTCNEVKGNFGRAFFPDRYPGNGEISAGKSPTGNHDTQMCAPDFNTGISDWYETVGPVGTTHELNHDDRFNHCMCELLDSNYAGQTTGFTPAGCPSAEEKLRQDCLTNPYGPDPHAMPNPEAPVRPECLRGLTPSANIGTWQSRICGAKDCGRGLAAQTDLAGNCSCKPPITDGKQGLPCINGAVAQCTGDDPNSSSCGCAPPNGGEAPLGNDPLCQYVPDDASWPGSLNGFFVANPTDAFVTQFNPTQQFVMLAPSKSIVGPTIYRNSLTAVPTTSTTNLAALRVKALITAPPVGSSNIDLQVYITSRGLPSGMQPLTHDFMGSVRLNSLTPGVPTDVSIPLDQTRMTRAFSGQSFNIEYTLQNTGNARFTGIGSQLFTGASTAIPLASRAPVCPKPAPGGGIGPVTLPNPLAVALKGTPTSPALLDLSTGQKAVLSDLIPVLRIVQ
jgi:hypothetical protein